MPYPVNHIPAYCKHRASGRAVVRLNGIDHYLGAHGTKASKIEYDRLITEWMANNRTLPAQRGAGMLMIELIAAFMDHAAQYYRNADGTPTSEVQNFVGVLRVVKNLYGETPAADFSPLCLKAVREKMIGMGWARTNINRQINRIRTFFKWATSCELVSVTVGQALQTVAALKRGRTNAHESEPVRPVAESHVRAVLPHVSSAVGAMLELQLLTGMRSGEVTKMRACDLDMTGEDWFYSPAQHKTAHLGHAMRRPIVGRAKDVVKRFLTTNPQQYLFRPIDADAERRARQHEQRKTPLSCGNRPGSNKRRAPKKSPGEFFDSLAYYKATRWGCAKAYPWPGMEGRKLASLTPEELIELKAWNKAHAFFPHQIRHNVATRVREKSGLEAAGAAMGHRTLSATQIYAERSQRMALDVARELA